MLTPGRSLSDEFGAFGALVLWCFGALVLWVKTDRPRDPHRRCGGNRCQPRASYVPGTEPDGWDPRERGGPSRADEVIRSGEAAVAATFNLRRNDATRSRPSTAPKPFSIGRGVAALSGRSRLA